MYGRFERTETNSSVADSCNPGDDGDRHYSLTLACILYDLRCLRRGREVEPFVDIRDKWVLSFHNAEIDEEGAPESNDVESDSIYIVQINWPDSVHVEQRSEETRANESHLFDGRFGRIARSGSLWTFADQNRR